ncbi:UrvD/REP family ATP-dependent DNA helicase [Janibacter melonis]|uniref:UrvD/REP family ATP-dependent DNA helicase n=1 Tax=Janibacter melonis TaxID=262209 RepID=UPI001919B72E|nr:UrvD/REP family ATP-dependent DNA helicase [Janibacter melonis]
MTTTQTSGPGAKGATPVALERRLRPGAGGVRRLGRERLDDDQAAAGDARAEVLVGLGGPGTGRTAVAVECALDRVRTGECRPDEVVLVGATRRSAAELRDAVTSGLTGAAAVPLARTVQSLGFAVLRAQAAVDGLPPPRLISGAQQDLVLSDLLAGHAETGTGPRWPQRLHEALPTRAMRDELRDLLMRAVEHGLTAEDLRDLGVRHGRPEWVAAAEVFEEYEQVGALATPGAYDPAWVLTAAAELLEGDAEARVRALRSVGCVVVDDAHELTAPAARLLRVFAASGVPLVLLGDPDSSVQGFRGADPALFLGDWAGRRVERVVLRTGYRVAAAVAEADARVVARIGALGGGVHRGASAAHDDGTCTVRVLRSQAQEAGYVAHALRRAHLVDGVPWDELAVVVRGAGRQSTLRRVLAARGVPVTSASADVPLRDQPSVAPLLLLLRLVVDLQRGHRELPDVEEVLALLTSPLLGADTVAVRRLRRALRAAELADEGGRSSDELLQHGTVDPAWVDHLLLERPDVAPLARLARVVASACAAAVVEDGRWAQGVSGEGVLWAAWEAVEVADLWRERALAGGAGGARADEALDAVVALFSAAAAHEDARPGSGPESFLLSVAQEEVAADSLADRSPDTGAVAIVTPAAAAGRQWRRVVVAGVQEGVWPDLRLRGSLLGSTELVDVVTGRAAVGSGPGDPGADDRAEAARAQVRYDETRMLHVAITRASEHVLLTAVSSEDEQPSPFLSVVDPLPAGVGRRETHEAPMPLDLVGVVARLRQELAEPERAHLAATRLAHLREVGVRGADPDQWWALRDRSDERPLRGPDELVRVSPSQVEAFDTCGLRWLLTSSGGGGASHVSADIGTLVHAVAEDLPDADHASIAAEIERRWPQLGQPPGWVGEQHLRRAQVMGRWLADYYVRARTEGWSLAGVEIPFAATVGRARIGGRVDRLERRDADGALRVVDLKTGSTKPTGDELAEHRQLGAYQVAVEEGGFGEHGSSSAGAVLVQLGRAATSRTFVQAQVPLRDADDPRWAHDAVAAAADGMSAAHMVARPEEAMCSRCPVRTSCPTHHEGGTLR